MEWSQVETTAKASGWGTFMATAGSDGRPHVAFIAPAFVDGHIWLATHHSSRKFRNLAANPQVAFHWPVGAEAQVFVRGTVELFTSAEDRHRLWDANMMPYDMHQFFSGPDDPNLVFVEVTPTSASLQRMGGMAAETWKP